MTAQPSLFDAPPDGFVYVPGFLTREDEARLLTELATLRFDPIVMHGREARRTARHFGLDYDYERRTPMAGEPLPEWLEEPRARLAALAGVEADAFVEILVQRYPVGSTIGWHRDAPAFEVVGGLSLGGACRMRFRRVGSSRAAWEQVLEPRSAYVLAGDSRWSWRHSIPATREERYSVTFRTLR